ncbi:DUF4347 domain-containing protein, partial [Nitrospira lenta]|uniref:DUF4347 domain-containing protein n=1 Tax=Nitrospira lenta TaxID=1436998 RepID=UPI000EFC8811
MFWRKWMKKTGPVRADSASPSSPPHDSLKSSLRSLEPRLMFDAAAAATAAEVKSEQVAQDQAEAAVSSEPSADGTTAESTDSQELLQAIAAYTPGESRTEVAFIDPTVPDYDVLVAGMGPNVEVVMLDATRDGMEQIAESLAGRTGIDAIHLISHGAEGRLNLGTGALTQESMTGQYADELATIQQSLSTSADILVYGCNFADGAAGTEAATLLSALTGADVAASTDATGNIALGGDWVLEIQTGQIETHIALSDGVQADWVGLLSLTASGGETRVNTTTTDTQTHNSVGNAYNPDSVAMDANGNFVSVWESAGDIHGQRYISDGTAQGSEFVIASHAATERLASVSMNSSGAFVVTWERDQGTGDHDIYARLYNASGTAVGSEFLVNETQPNDQQHARVAMAADGSFAIVFESNSNASRSSAYDVHAQRYDATGTKIGSNVLVNTTTDGYQGNADIAMDSAGNFVIVWDSERSVGSGTFSVYGQQYGSSGVAQGGEFLVNTTASGTDHYASVAKNNSGDFVVTWVRHSGGDTDVQAQRFNSVGVAQGSAISVTSTTLYDQEISSVAMDQSGNFAVSWSSDLQDGSGWGVYTRQYDLTGAALTTETQVAATSTNIQDYSGIAYQNGKVVVIWSGNGTGDTTGIFMQRYDAVGGNVAPTITSLSGDSLNYHEGDGAVVVEQGGNVLVADVDSTNLDTGTLTISIPAGSDSAEDVLSIRNQGTSAGQIGVSGSTITYGGTAIGTFTGGGSGSALVITFNSNATPTTVTALVKNITYENIDTNAPTTGARTVRFVLTDGDGGTSANYDMTVTVSAVNDAPTSSGGLVSGIEDTPAVLTWGQFNVSDVDSPINANSAVCIQSLPALGSLQVLVDGEWKAAALNQIVTKATIDAGNLRYVPVADESGYSGYATPGIGNQHNDYAQFTFAPIQGTPITIVNPNAEANIIPEGTWQQNASGWTTGTVSPYTAGAQNTTGSQFSGDHDNTFFVEQGGTWLGQIMYTAFNSTKDYVLSLDVGWQLDRPASQYRVELWAGGTRLGVLDETQVTEVQGSLVQATLHINGAGFAAQNGQWLGLWMVGVDGQTNFDNLQLVSYDRSTDIGAAATMTVDITPVNDAPVLADTALNVTVAEDAGAPSGAVGSLVSAFTGGITDVDSGASKGLAITGSNETNGTWYYTMNGGTTWTAVGTVSNTSALLLADNGSTRLYFSPGADYNGTSSAALTMRAWDQTSGTAGTKVSTASNGGTTTFSSATDTIDVTVTAVNDAPTDLSLSANTVAENATNGTVVGTVSGTDPDNGDTKTYSFTDSAGGRFAINTSTGVITVADGNLLNYESATSHSVTVRVTDSGGLTYDETFAINLTDVNETPTDLALSSN